MPHLDPRGVRLWALDAHVAALAAPLEAARLTVLGAELASHLVQWGKRMEPLDVGVRAPFDASRAAALVLESVFDEVLTPSAWLVLAAALDLAVQPA